MNNEFSEEEKIKYFDEICEKYYRKNFSLTSKSEMDLLMFKFFYQNKLKRKKSGDFNADSDYLLSKELGITQSRVRNLKIKKELVYPEQNYDWKEQFLNLISFAQYDEQTKKIIMNIPDPNLQIEIENHIEQRGLFIEKQLNSKLLQVRVEYFIELVISLDENISQDDLIENMKAQISELSSVDKKIMKKGFGKVVKEKGISSIELLSAIVTIAPAVQPIIAMIS
ncbi:hypothetical protein JZO73_03845 [Enterococcus plantarum]|uniref:hypothetical protein n=1 Tax=Enterococcus plantarum TaxID=1077675 RepID=UPI001A8F09EE|nr:hypothetical protein [Enterococcus plantarum]MBO0466662.1 hypothetical protein [Enterococcus plantarum]